MDYRSWSKMTQNGLKHIFLLQKFAYVIFLLYLCSVKGKRSNRLSYQLRNKKGELQWKHQLISTSE